MTDLATPPATPTTPAPSPAGPIISALTWLIGWVVGLAVVIAAYLWFTQQAEEEQAKIDQQRPAKEAAVSATQSYYDIRLARLDSDGTNSVDHFPTEVDAPTVYYWTRLASGDVRICQYELTAGHAIQQGAPIPTVYCDLPGGATYSDWGSEWRGGKWTALEPVR